ncbi:hypothetical protein CDAR_574471 [Caerostris darwini]|uniref:Uncharacterized protein n=1 Tax=Caerostris darwini TaxID=1538125 RepID=A0AAV4UI24_9ARAC|nr:hypothetical protein CDAR_574471 [Caerostris darwini]
MSTILHEFRSTDKCVPLLKYIKIRTFSETAQDANCTFLTKGLSGSERMMELRRDKFRGKNDSGFRNFPYRNSLASRNVDGNFQQVEMYYTYLNGDFKAGLYII